MEVEILKANATVDSLFGEWREALGDDYLAYRNHVYRVLNLTLWGARGITEESVEKVAVAAAFHDVGIWLDGTFDYLGPSSDRARRYLAERGRDAWLDDVVSLIEDHHKIFPSHAANDGLTEAFRRADWLDVCLFALPTKFPRSALAALLTAFPRSGFHRRLVELGGHWGLRHPLRPLPMLKL